MVADAGEMVIPVNAPLLTVNAAWDDVILPVHALTFAVPGLIPAISPLAAFAMAILLVVESICQNTLVVIFFDVPSE
jgi:hypothetical protein